MPAKLAGCALLGAAAATLAGIAPKCAAGPFEALDPLVHRFWYERVLEGQPLWRQSTAVAGVVIAFPLVGLYGTWRGFKLAEGERRTDWALLLFLLTASTCPAIMIQREGAIANMLALPGGVLLFERALARPRARAAIRGSPERWPHCCWAVTPSYAIGAIDSRSPSCRAAANMKWCSIASPRISSSSSTRCRSARLPRRSISARRSSSSTHQKAIASGHHRAAAAMADVIRIFTRPLDQSRQLLAEHGANYVAVCPGLIEPALYKDEGPNGLWAQLSRGQTPAWLEPVRFNRPMRLRVWRVKPAA